VSVPAASEVAAVEVVEPTGITEEPELVTTAVSTRRARRRDENRDDTPAAARRGGGCVALLLAFGSVGALTLLLLVIGGGTLAYLLWPEPSTKSNVTVAGNIGLPIVPDGDIANANNNNQAAQDAADSELPGEVTHDISRDFAAAKDKNLDPQVGGAGVQLNPQVLAKLKLATVYIRVTTTTGLVGSGSGFFTGEPGLIVTNAHVLDMLDPANPPPKKIEVVYKSGEKDSHTFDGQIVAVDRASDLGILRIKGNNLPEPLLVKNSAGLQLTQTVYVVGFPLGENLGADITVSQTSISSLRTSPKTGEITQVQVNGGMHQGNSGGPVVTANGDVIGVAVAIIKGTQINFAVPGELVHLVLNGRLMTLTGGGTFKDANQVKMRVMTKLADPLGRLQKVRLAWWAGNKGDGKTRPPSATPPPTLPGDSEHKVVDMTVKDGEARCDFVVPDLEPGQVIWLQPVVTNKAGQEQWASAWPFVTAMPAEKQPALLALKPMWGARPVTFACHADMSLVQPGLKTDSDSATMIGTLTETMVSEQNNTSSLRWRYNKYTTRWPNNVLRADQIDQMNRALPQISALHADLIVDPTNRFDRDEPDLAASTVPDNTKTTLIEIHHQVQRMLDLLAVSLPGKQCQAGETWPAVRTLQIPYALPGTVNVTYTYRGVRQRDGRPEAVVSVFGVCNDFGGRPVNGKVKGIAILDLTCHQIAQSSMSAVMDMNDFRGHVTIKMDSKMERTLGKEILNVRDQLTATDPVDAKQCPYKVHTVQLEAGRPTVVSLESFKGPGWFDTFVRIEDGGGKVLMQDDNKGVDVNSLVVFTPPQSGQYRVVATSLQRKMGSYLLVVRQ
jgi:S1-C subfamily serine protease